jgi:hypothetical protein
MKEEVEEEEGDFGGENGGKRREAAVWAEKKRKVWQRERLSGRRRK